MIDWRKKALLALVCCFLLGGCGGASTPPPETGDVQDIQPGDPSVIQSPRTTAPSNNIEERTI